MSRVFIAGAYASHLLPGWTILYISKHTIPPRAGVEYVSLVRIHVLVVRFTAHPSTFFFLWNNGATSNNTKLYEHRFEARSKSCEKRLWALSCQSVRMEFACHWKNFHEILHFKYFSKIRRENSSFIQIFQE
jgi:hypothetical protein